MAPVLASTSSLGVRPWLAGAVAPAAAPFRAPVADTAGWPPGSGRALRVRTPLTWLGVKPWLAGAVAPAAAPFRAPVADTAGWPPGSGRALRVRTPLTWLGV